MEIPETSGFLPNGPVRRMFAAANRHDIEAMVECFANSYVNVTPNHPDRSFTGRGQVRKNWSTLFAGVPDIHTHVVGSAVAADGRTWVEWGAAGTRRDGVAVAMAGVLIASVEAGKIAAARFYLEPVEHKSGGVDDAVRSVATGVPGHQRSGGEQ